MNAEMIIFFVISLVTLSGAVLLLLLDKVVHMVLALSFSFLGVAGLFVLLNAEFIAVAQVLIYVGAVTIIMLFGIMLTRHDDQDETRSSLQQWITGLSVGVFFLIIIYAIDHVTWAGEASSIVEETTTQIGIQIFAKYVIPFELTSIVLLVALIGAILLAKPEHKEDGKVGEANE